ncbi:hypothetical protein DXA59_00950 [Clostridium sp. OF03-18AA]|nr:hypothetical protein [Clostridium sp. OF03-18AA]RHP71571.1 hypothetical protein DXA59_00950 [Clostridium sp. OF03-18AA]
MAYQTFYVITDWQNLPSQKTALNRTNLLHLENGVKEADIRIVQLDASKLSMEIANTLVKSVNVDTKTGVITVTKLNGAIETYDLDIERVVTNFDVTDEGVIILTLADGTEKSVDIAKFINTFKSSATIAFGMTDREVTARIIDGSVTMDKLDPTIQSEFRQYMIESQNARDAALQYQKFAKRYTIGDSEFEGSETDNAKYYYEGTKQAAETTVTNAAAAARDAETATSQAAIAASKATNAAASANSAAADAQTASEKASTATSQATLASQKAQEAASSERTATTKAADALDSANDAKRYAVGGVVAEDAQDNAKYYYEQSQILKNQIDAAASLVVPQFFIDLETGALMSDKKAQGMRFWLEDGAFYGEAGSEEMEVTA